MTLTNNQNQQEPFEKALSRTRLMTNGNKCSELVFWISIRINNHAFFPMPNLLTDNNWQLIANIKSL
jgi:hypothetical protein